MDISVIPTRRNVAYHHTLPDWLQDNDLLLRGHRVPTNSFKACFKSVFHVHTETGNIWTHLLGMVAFLGMAVYFLSRPSNEIRWQDKVVFSTYFVGSTFCMGMSWIYHTVSCHSERVGRLFLKLDYCGIALMTLGSLIPWIYYVFYCRPTLRAMYISLAAVLCVVCIVVSMSETFGQKHYRPLRAGVFTAFGGSSTVPVLHFAFTEDFWYAFTNAGLGWLFLMGVLFIIGAGIYASRVPEIFFPGKFDIWFQSHQIFHVFAFVANLVSFHGIAEIANYRLTLGDCIGKE